MGLALGMVFAVPAMAQDQFPDVPANHWAYDALENLKKEGIMVGYPDGRVRGTRLATRYEMAVAINAAFKKMSSMMEGINSQLAGLEGMKDAGELKATLDQLKADVASMKAWGDDIANMKKLVGEFEKELTGLGADVDQMKSKLGDLDKRVTALEGVKLPVAISGDLNFYAVASNARGAGSAGFLDKTGRVSPTVGAGGTRGGLTRDLQVFHELALNLKGTNESGPQWNATVVYGNFLGVNGVLADFNNPGGGAVNDNQTGNFYISDASVKFGSSIGGLGFGAEVGRVAVAVSPYLFARPDYTPYYSGSRYDDGKHRMDGAVIGFKLGGVDVTILGGRNSNRRDSQGGPLNSIPNLGQGVDGTLGAVVGFNVGTAGKINAAYLFHDNFTTNALGNASGATGNRVNVYGLDANLKFGQIAVGAGYAKSKISRNTKSVTNGDTRNSATYLNAGYEASNWGLSAEYRKVEQNYVAAGNWRRIGTAWNPTGIQSFAVMAHIKPTAALKLSASGEFGDVLNTTPKTKFTSIILGAEYVLNNAWTIDLGYEDVKVEIPGTDAKQKWATLGLGYNLGTNTMLRLAYEYGSANTGAAFGAVTGSNAGGQFTTQLSIRF